jgi:putative transposase
MRRLDELHLEYPFMGARMLRRQLQSEGLQVGRRHVRTLMLRMGMEALCPQPGTSKRHPNHQIYPYLLRHLAITRANQAWALDTTYIPMARGFAYLTAVVDVASRMVLAHKVAITMEACPAREIIEQVCALCVPEIINTDQGSQFTAEEFTKAVLDSGGKLSTDGRGAWRDNVFVERLWRSVKYECAYLKAYDGVSAARADIGRYMMWFNTHRAHSSLNGATPQWAYLNLSRNLSRPPKMKSLVRPELPTASAGSPQAPAAAVDNSAPVSTHPESTFNVICEDSGGLIEFNRDISRAFARRPRRH